MVEKYNRAELRLMGVFNILKGLVSPISEAYKAKQELKKAKESASAKLSMAKQDSEFKLNFTHAEWEALSKQNEDGTWKDEYITVIITSPFILLFIAGVITGFTGDQSYLYSVNTGIKALKELGVDLGELMYVVVLAAVSIKGLGIIRK